ncbi:MAG: ATP-binding protein [Acidilobus sp.]
MMSPCKGERELGWIVGESTPRSSQVLFKGDHEVPQAGTYVVAETPAGCVFGMIETVTAGNRLLSEDVTSPDSVDALVRTLNENPLVSPSYVRGSIRWLSYQDYLVKGLVVLPKVPPRPGTIVYSASADLLKNVFGSNESRGWIELGSLINNEEVRYSINVNRLMRHLAILAVTGGGKSNTVCVLAREIVQKLRGTVVIFDMHGEYSNIELSGQLVNVLKPAMNPVNMAFEELRELAKVPESAVRQERAIRQAWALVHEGYSEGKIKFTADYTLVDALIDTLEKLIEKGDVDEEGGNGALNRLKDVKDKYADVLDHGVPLDLTKVVVPGRLNVFDLSGVDEEAADAIVSHYLRRILTERKRLKRREESGAGRLPPTIVVIEEAHILIPARDHTLTKYWASRVAREGRKFGVGLVIVSQRPRNVDPDVLSQTNNKIILRVVEPQDIRYVQEASEELSEDLAALLPSLNPGEAVVIGSMVKLPAIVKVDICKEKSRGGDIDVISEWEAFTKGEARRAEEVERSLEELL